MAVDVQTDRAEHVSDADLVRQARAYIALRNELFERGEALGKMLARRGCKSTALIVADGDKVYELVRNYGAGRFELPVGVAPVEILGYGE